MRGRFPLVLIAALVALVSVAAISPALAATASIAQPEPGEGQDQDTSGGEESGQSQDDPDAETGASEDQAEGDATETGPPWTYQMARISLLGLLALLLACGYLYWRLVAQRRRGAP